MAVIDKHIRNMPLLETQTQHFLHVISEGTVSTNMFLVRLQDLAPGMNWLVWPIVPKKRWPSNAGVLLVDLNLLRHGVAVFPPLHELIREPNPEVAFLRGVSQPSFHLVRLRASFRNAVNSSRRAFRKRR